MMKILDIFQKIEREDTIKKTKDLFRKSIISKCLPFFLIISLATNSNGITKLRVDPTGFVHKSYNNVPSDNAIATLVRKPLQGIDTVVTNVYFDQWATSGSNFIPELTENDTLISYVTKDTLGRTFTATTWLTGGGRRPLEVCLDDPAKSVKAFTPQINTIEDTSNIASLLIGTCWLKKNPAQPCTALVDTAGSPFHVVDYYVNLEYQDSTFKHGDSAYIKLEKTRNDTTWLTLLPFVIDTTYWDAMLVKDSVYFPSNFTVFKDIGIEDVLVPDSADSGQVITPGVVVRNHGTINQNPYLHCKINEFYHDSMQVTSSPGTDTFFFDPCSLNQVGNWLVTAYGVLLGDVNPANDTLRDTITVNPVGIVEKTLENKLQDFKIYPSHGNIFNVEGYRGKVSIYDETGRKVGVSMIQEEKGKLNLVYLPPGIYFIKPEDVAIEPKKVVKLE